MRSLRVLVFSTRDWYNPATTGGDNNLWENARYLVSVGHEVTFVVASFPGARSEETLDGIRVVRLGGIHTLWLRTCLFYLLHCRGRYDVVVTEGFGGSRIPRLAPLYVREPIITAWHQIHRELFAAQYPKIVAGSLNVLERTVAWVHRNTLVQAYTPEWKTAFPSIGFKPENVFVVPASIRDEWLNESDLNAAAEPKILWIGKFRRYKCPHHLVLAMADVLRQLPDAHLTLVGRHDDASYEAHLRQLVTELVMDRNVEFRFNVTEQEKRDLLRGSRVLVLPSSVEGFGIVVLEANACGVPVIASTGVPESVVRAGINGLRYPFGDTRALGSMIVQLLESNDLYSRLAANSLKNVQEFAWSRVGARFEKVVSNLAGEREGQKADK